MTNTNGIPHCDEGSHRSSGFSLVELMVALVIFTVISITLLHHLTISYSSTRDQRHRVFAYTKAQAILAELHALIDSSNSTATIDLDQYDDGAAQNPVLSIATENGNPIAADHPVSDNTLTATGWEWYRRITVRPFSSTNNRGVRYVTVKIFQSLAPGKEKDVATLSSVINSMSSGYPTTQVYDVYMLAIENIPGWWVFMENIVPSVEAAVTDLESRNPGLIMRTHWITKASYGRNQGYRPYINAENDTLTTVPYAYYYPGKMPAGMASNYYYVPSMMRARMNQDGTEIHGYDANLNPHPYALADFYNHAMRLPKELDLHEQRVALVQQRRTEIEAAKAAKLTPPPELDDMSEEPTLRILLEDMNTDPDKYRHSLMINLHGELVPMPAIRNYSDPAKTPLHPGLRVVTHPEELRTFRDPSGASSEDVYLRVYAWSADRNKHYPPSGASQVTDPMAEWIMVDIMDVDLRGPETTKHSIAYWPFHTNGSVRAMQGGVTFNGGKDYPPVGMTHENFPEAEPYSSSTPDTNEMRYILALASLPSGRKFTRILLWNTPIRCDPVTSSLGPQGLPDNVRSRLFGLEYNPAPTGDKTFERDLAATGDGPKNTARWRIKIPSAVLSEASRWYKEDGTPLGASPTSDVRLTIRTHIWDNSVPWPQQPGSLFPVWQSPDNMSETYAWWGATKDAVPMTERSQFLGDPRFNPYKDLLDGDADFPNGYNWFFAKLNSATKADFPGIVRTYNRWNGALRQDVPRFFELFRGGLVNSETVYTTLTGYSYYYMGHGNEIGYDSANGYPWSIPTNMRPFGVPGGGFGVVDNITGYRRYIREHSGSTDHWWGMPWLGELYPDSAEPMHWRVHGNLIAGNTGPDLYYRAKDSDCLGSARFEPSGTTASSAKQRTQTKGCVSFMNNGTASSHFNHHFNDATATLVGSGLELQANYNFLLPLDTPCNRPFDVSSNGNVPPEWYRAPYSSNRFVASVMKEYYDRGSLTGSGVVQLENPSQTNAAFIVVSGLSETTTLGSSFIAKYSLLAMLQSYFEAGSQSMTHRIVQTPRIEITSPNELTEIINPETITLAWNVSWVRWDGKKYTAGTPGTFAEDESEIEYSLMYSRDNGTNWIQLAPELGGVIDAGIAATPGKPPANPSHLVSDLGTGPEIREWETSASQFPHAGYMLRIEAFRKNQILHYSQHVTRFFIDR